MELTTINMPKAEAEAKLVEWKTRVDFERSKQDEQIAAGYKALAAGLPIIKLAETISAGGWFENGLPRIAIARANSQDCWINVEGPYSGSGSLIYSSEQPPWQPRNRGALVNEVTVRVTVPNMERPKFRREWRGHTMMPIIPPNHRPVGRRLHQFHILWEVEEWKLVPPKDPALLKWIAGDLWAVHFAWDLTELERAVLAR